MLERDSVSAPPLRGARPGRPASKGARIGVSAGACVAAVSVLAACGSSGGTTSSSGSGQVKGTVIVFAAASLTNAFNKIGSQFEKAHPGVSVKFNYAGSSSLATSIKQGAKADLFASADTTNMQTVTSASLSTGQPKIFAKNKLEILVDKGNPMKITSVADLAKPAVKVAVCAPSVPCGKYSTEIFDKANVKVKPVTEETSVSGVVTKVTLGEADAGIVYVTDVKSAAGKATGVPIPPNQNVVADYPIVQLKDAPNSPAAKSFMQYVDGSSGQKVLDSYGFLPPGS
jgi:molybdate transport system substrate-binding protein